jgi:hypothetical protein
VRTMRFLCSLLALLLLLSAVGCASTEQRTLEALRGAWYDDGTGLKYEFVSDAELVVPETQPDGGNTVKYSIVSGDNLRIENAGVVRIAKITELTDEKLVLAASAANEAGVYYREWAKTTVGKKQTQLIEGALEAAGRFAATRPMGGIVWISTRPSGKGSGWTTWPTTTIGRYRTAWDWTSLTAAEGSVDASGTGEKAVYTVSLVRTPPTQEELDAKGGKSGVLKTGGPRLPVGFSAAFKKQPAGTLFYTERGMLYSLGEGYAIGVRIGLTQEEGFWPMTGQ